MALVECPKCGTHNLSGVKVCSHCGFDFVKAEIEKERIEEEKRKEEKAKAEQLKQAKEKEASSSKPELSEKEKLRIAEEERKRASKLEDRKIIRNTLLIISPFVAIIAIFLIRNEIKESTSNMRFETATEAFDYLCDTGGWIESTDGYTEYIFYRTRQGEYKVKENHRGNESSFHSVTIVNSKKGKFEIDGYKHSKFQIKKDGTLARSLLNGLTGNITYIKEDEPKYTYIEDWDYTPIPIVENKEQRCWYCGKVIVNSEGTVIHATHDAIDMYICEYCGKTNVIKDE